MNVMRKNADWKARRLAQGKKPLFMKDYDPEQPRDENGRWTDMGAVDRPALIAKRKSIMEEMRPLAEKGTMHGSEATRFMELGNQLNEVLFDLTTTKEFIGDKIKSEGERMSTLSKDIVMTAHKDLFGNRDVFMAIGSAAFGTQNDALTDVDKLYTANPDKLYNRFNETRAALKTAFGDTMKLYRAEGKQRSKPTKNWATTREYAAQFGSNIISQDIPVDDIIAVNVGPTGSYHEMIVRNRMMQDYDPDQPRDENGRWTNTAAFKEWFRESKVAGKDGKPLVVYHGTTADFDQFIPQSHFGTYKAAQARMKMRSGEGHNVMPVYLSIQNPLPVEDNEASDEATLLNSIKRGKYPKLSLDIANRDGAVAAAKAAGYDGLIYTNGLEDRGKASYVAFDPSQIKSAIGNSGKFDSKSKRIIDAANRGDMTGTEKLQKLFKKDMKRRWQDVRKRVREGLQTYDFTGVGDRIVPFQNWLDQIMVSHVLGSGMWMSAYLKRSADMGIARAQGLVQVQDGYDPDQPRDPKGSPTGGQWASLSKLQSGKEALDRGVWTFEQNRFSDRWNEKITGYSIMSNDIPTTFKSFERKPGDVSYYDPNYIEVEQGDYPMLKMIDPANKDTAPRVSEPNTVYRGMSFEEYQQALKTGEIKSLGGYNLGTEQEGLTFYSTEVDQATSYASGYAPWQFKPTPSRPAVVVAVKDPGHRDYTYHTEVGFKEPLKTADITKVYMGHVVAMSPGIIETVETDGKVREGSRSSPSPWVVWKEEKPIIRDYDPDQPRDENGRWTLEFGHWFGSSKALNEDGTPTVMYHATSKYFDEFKAGGFDPELSGPAIWLSPYKDSQPAMHNTGGGDRFKEGAQVLPVYVRAENPLLLDDKDTLEWAQAVYANGSKEFPLLLSPKTVASLKEDGYDSIHYDAKGVWGREKEDEWIVFDPNQLKSAISNKGTYSRKSNKLHDADVDWMRLMQDATVSELRGIMEAVAQQATRMLGKGIISRKNPTNDILSVITNVGEARGNMLVNHAIIKTFSVATLETFRSMGVEQVGTIPETVPHTHIGDAARVTKQPRGKGGKFKKYTKPLSQKNRRKAEKQYVMLKELSTVNVLTAEDDRVCDTCERISDDGPYGIDQAMSLIPAHINCRCVFIPVGRLPMQDYDPNQPRAPKGVETGGQWVSSIEAEGASEAGGGITSTPKYHQPDQRVFEVGGDTWNKSKASQLELEYVEAKAALEAIEASAVGQTVSTSGDPGTWESVSEANQDLIKESWFKFYFDTELEHQINSWRESGDADVSAAYDVMYGLQSGDDNDWAFGAIDEVLEDYKDDEGNLDYPFDTQQLVDALHGAVKDGTTDSQFSFDNEMLDKFRKEDPNQLDLPGIAPPIKFSEKLTQGMRIELVTMLKVRFKDVVEERAQNMDPPDYLTDNANESLEMTWDDLSEDNKYQYAKSEGFFEDDDSVEFEIEDVPATYNPTQEPGMGDYAATQHMARYMSLTRGQQLIKERFGEDISTGEAEAIDTALWKSWVDSSTSNLGVVIQAAIADEFEARYRDEHFTEKLGLKNETSMEYAQRISRQRFGDNGYGKVRAMIRAKWETTQFMLDKADMPMVNLYRGLTLTKEELENTTKENIDVGGSKHTKLPDVSVLRNGAASTTHDIAVANKWKGMEDTKITLRAVVPRTAIISVPAYGVNIHRERESVLMGTAWVGWDAYWGDAPTLEDYKLNEVNPQ